jgi:hypothetical protein
MIIDICTIKDSITILCAGRDPVEIPLKGAGRWLTWPARDLAGMQPLCTVKVNTSIAKEHRLAQVQLYECCEELGTRVNLSTLHLNFQQIVYHASDITYEGIKIRDLEKHILEHGWKEKRSVLHYGYFIVLV